MNQGGYSVTELMGRGWGWPFLGIQIRHLRLRMFIASLLHVVASTIIVCYVCKWSRCSVRQRLSINQEVSTWPGLKIAQSSVDRDCDLISVTHSSFILTRLIISPVPWSQSVNVSMFYSRNKDGFFYIILSDQLCTFFFIFQQRLHTTFIHLQALSAGSSSRMSNLFPIAYWKSNQVRHYYSSTYVKAAHYILC